jgi:hypothetical protein
MIKDDIIALLRTDVNARGKVMKINTKKVVVGMPPEIYAALEKLAGKKRHTVPSYIRWLIWKHIDETDMQISLFSKGEE